MKKLLNSVSIFLLGLMVGIPQAQAATNDYSIEVKSKKFSKQTTKGFYGIGYTEDNASYTDQYWPLVEGYHSLPLEKAVYYNGNTKQQIVRQFGVSMGVVYWINPDRDEICWWNTITGESGSTTPSLKYPDNYTVGVESPNVPFSFNAKLTGPGTMSHDWYGNLIHMWNESAGWTDNSFVQGYAIYKAATTYGELMDFHPKISYMNGTDYPVYRRKLNADGTLTGKTDTDDGHIPSNYTYYEPGTANGALRNPNYPADDLNWTSNYDYHKANTTYTKKRTDFMGVSGNLWGKGFKSGGNFSYSSYYAGYASGYVFHARNDIAFGNMFADGQYTNWYLNYLLFGGNRVYNDYRPVSQWWLASDIINWYKPWASAQTYYPNERLFRECDVLEYWWSIPLAGLAEFNAYYSVGTNRPNYKWRGWVDDLDLGLPDYDYLSSSERRQTDAMSAPEIDSIKGTRILIHNYWIQFTPGASVEGSESATGNQPKRNGMFMIRSLKYNGGTMNDSEPLYTGNIATSTNAVLNYNKVGCAFGYNNTANTPVKFTETAVNCWPELERVNDNVFALYTHVPGQGFSKFFITAVKPNNAVSNLKVAQSWNPNGDPVHTLTWTPQAGDRATMHTYEVWYRKKKGSTYEDKKTIDGASRDVWNFAGKASVKYNGANDSIVASSGNKSGVKPNKAFYNSYTDESCKFEFVAPRGDNGDGTKYERTYEYMVIPVYDASSHRGTEATTSIVTAPAPGKVYGNLYQVTDNEGPNGETRYAFSIRLDPYFPAGAIGSTEAKRLIITSSGGEEGSNKLKGATSVTFADGTPITPLDGITFVEKSDGSTRTHGAYALSIDITGKVGADGKLPSIIWHNVDPDLEYKMAVHVEALPTYQYSGSGEISTTLVAPCPTLSLTEVSVYPLHGDYSSIQNDDLLPLGAQRRVGSKEVTNPVTLSNANTIGTKGSAINPLLVTDEVLENWNVQYLYNIFKDAKYLVAYRLDPSNTTAGATYYSNSKKVIFDIVGLPVERTAWDTHTKMGLDDAQIATNDNLTKYGYNTATTNHNYTAHIDVTYTRKDNSEINAVVMGENIASSPLVYGEGLKSGSIFPNLGVDFGTQFVVIRRTSTHWDANAEKSDEDPYGGYFPIYYDAVAQWAWPNFNSNLNHYVGFHAVTKMNCVGHYVTNADGQLSSTWVPYYAPSVLSDYYVEQTNSNLGKDGNYTDNYNGAVVPLVMKGIGYDGTKNTNWSALAAKELTLPMQVHYVWAGNRELTNEESDRKLVSTKVLMTADYPIIESTYGATIIHDATFDIDNSYYNLMVETNVGETRMNMISSENHSNGVYANYVTTVTGVEGVLTNACGGVKIYPNPVQSSFTLEAPMDMGTVKIFSTSGHLVKEINNVEASRVTIIVNDLPQGVYIVNTLGVAQIMMKM